MLTVPPLGIVTEPWIVLPLMLKLAVLAPPLTAEPRLAALANWLGSVSTKLAPSSVDGPALLITKLKVVVAPTATVVVFDSLATPRLTAGNTPSTAVTVAELVPTDVVNEPDAIVFVKDPATELVTTAVSVHVEPCAIRVFAGRVNDPPPAIAKTDPLVQPTVVVTEGLALTTPIG